ncbi:transketolase C-terminal domain-containing protein [Desulfococcaceae bacterium HSG9]|nr:transketolase C-terminal domain-containing protein [Desulfococcaceae bacterium HSG9]
MRNAFADELKTLAASNHQIVLLSGDIGNRLFDPYKKEFLERFFNCGVAEANMTGMAAGMALCGLRPITYTITPFNTTRCLEQIRIDVCYHELPVIIVGVGAGLSYAGLGGTHHACEDIALLRALPNMTVICPADAVEVRLALRAALSHNGPVYIRLGKKNEPVIHKKQPQFIIGKGIIIRQGSDICLLSTGNILPNVIESAIRLEQKGISTQVVSMHTVKPLDNEMIEDVFDRFGVVATIEEHSLIGGFGAAVAEWLSDQPPQKGRLCRLGIKDTFLHQCGNQENARTMAGLDSAKIVTKVTNYWRQRIDTHRN